MAQIGGGGDGGEHTALKIHLFLLTQVSRFIFLKELNTRQHLCSSNQKTEDVKGYESEEEHQHTSAEEHSFMKEPFRRS